MSHPERLHAANGAFSIDGTVYGAAASNARWQSYGPRKRSYAPDE
jgi:hypothetical protein